MSREANVRTKWEYKTFHSSSLISSEEEFLEERGQLGWELVTVMWLNNLSKEKRYYFKRPLIKEKV
jgi:hypothetical protein